MSDVPPLLNARPDISRSVPTWMGLLRGIWLMTWRSQVTLRRLPWQVGMLLLLPLLVYITMYSQGEWAGRNVYMGDSFQEVARLTHRLKRAGIPFDQNTRATLVAKLVEVNTHSDSTWIEISGESAEFRRNRLDEHIADWDRKTLARAKAILNDRQYQEFQIVQESNRNEAYQRLTQVASRWKRTEPFYHWLIGFYFFIILPLTCVRRCGPLIRDELQADTLGFLVTRPIGRARLIIAKYISQVAWLELILLLETLLLFAVGESRKVPALGSLLPLVVGAQILAVPAWSALGLLLGQLTSRFMAIALLYGAVVEMGIGRIPTNINVLSIIRHLETLLSRNSELQNTFSWTEGDTATAMCALMLAPLIFLTAAALLFKFVEYHHAGEMQK